MKESRSRMGKHEPFWNWHRGARNWEPVIGTTELEYWILQDERPVAKVLRCRVRGSSGSRQRSEGPALVVSQGSLRGEPSRRGVHPTYPGQ